MFSFLSTSCYLCLKFYNSHFMIGAHCKPYTESDFSRTLLFNVKRALGGRYNFKVFKTVAESFEGGIDKLTLEYVLEHYPRKNLNGVGSETTKKKSSLSDKIAKHSGFWSREEADSNPRVLYVFTDNTDRDSGSARIEDVSWYAKKYGKGKHYPTMTTAVIRGKENARPISTVKWFYKNHPGVAHPKNDKTSQALWHDSDVEEFKKVVREELQDIVDEFNTGKYDTIMFPSGDGLFNGDISDISLSRTPVLYQALSELLTEFGFESLIPSAQETPNTTKKKQAAPERKNLGRYAVTADPAHSIEVSSAGDEFGRQFSALGAVFKEGTTFTLKIGGKKGAEQVFDIGGYSVEAAYQLLKGYERNPKGKLIDEEGNLIKINGRKISIEGKNKRPISDVLKIVSYNRTPLSKEMRENHVYQNAYLPLWKLWAEQNPELMNQLREKAGEEKILTDKFSGGSSVSQARALAEILWGSPETKAVSEYNKKRYELQRRNALEAAVAIPKIVAMSGNNKDGRIKFIDRTKVTDNQVAFLASGKDIRGNQIMDGKYRHKGWLVTFKTETAGLAAFNMNLNYFHNPFEGQKDAIKKYIQWIIPNDYKSLPKELQLKEYAEIRNKIREYFSKGGYTRMEILSDGTPENILFAKTLRYIIDNFRTLRQRYNPIDIQDFGSTKHRVKVIPATTASADGALRLAPEEVAKDVQLDDSNSVRLDRYDSKQKEESDQYVINLPENFHTQFSDVQQQRMVKTLAAAVPDGATVTIDADMATPQLVDTFRQVVKYGYDKVGTREVTTPDGNTVDVGIYRRREFTNSQVEKRDFTPRSVKDNYDGSFYIFENAYDKQLEETAAFITTRHNNDRKADSYLSDDKDFEWFKKEVDEAIDKAKKAIDEGARVVIPKDPMGSSSSALYHYAPKCYEYVNRRLQELIEYGNRGETAQRYMASATTTVSRVQGNPGETISLDVRKIVNPKMTLYQNFTNTEIRDLAGYFNERFVEVLTSTVHTVQRRIQQELEAEKDKRKRSILRHAFRRLSNPETQLLETLNQVTEEGIFQEMRKRMLRDIEAAKLGSSAGMGREGVPLVEKVLNTEGFFEMIFNYAIPLIEDNTGIRITPEQNTLKESEASKRDRAEDVAGEDSPEMGWSYNHRLVNPYASLTTSIRKMLNNIKMRDPNDRRKFLTDSLGRPKKYNSQYIYASIMSRMAKMTLGDINNFMTITPVEELSETDARVYPMGKPVFPVLEDMKFRYPWANDLIKQLSFSWHVKEQIKNHPGMHAEEYMQDKSARSSMGNMASQFYTNFCQHFVMYATMVNGRVIEENQAIGDVSLKQSAINNYEGNIRFKGIDMVYNSDGSINNDNVQRQLNAVRDILRPLQRLTSDLGPFWTEIDRLQKKYKTGSLYDAWDECGKEQKKTIHDITEAFLASGLQFNDFDIFSIVMGHNSKDGITTMLSEYELCLKSIVGLPKNEHMFESSKYSESQEKWSQGKMDTTTPRFYWNKFFEKFGDYVTERELVDSTRILGKSRYSYVYPSYMSTTLLNLTGPARVKYIEENFMPYEWFYDSVNKKFRNKFLEYLYNKSNGERAGNRMYGTGHDMLVKKDGYDEKEYQDWTREDILQIMFAEQQQTTNRASACWLAPVLSDSQICKVIQAPKVEVGEALTGMRDVVLQELWRMDLVEKRNIIFKMQDLQQMKDEEIELTSDQEKYYKQHLAYFQTYKRQHPERLEEVENFDKNGLNFCFYPELNNYRLSVDIAQGSNNTLMMQIIRILANDPNNPRTTAVSLKDALKALQNMSEDAFNRKAQQVGMTERKYGDFVDKNGQAQFGEYYITATKETAINSLIEEALRYILDDKVQDFLYDTKPANGSYGVFNEGTLNAIIKADAELMDRYNKRPQETENHHLSAQEAEELRRLNLAIYNAAKKFYYGHTYTMSQFLQLMVTDIAYYKDPTKFFGSIDFGKRFKEVYGAGMKLNTNSKFGKKFERSIILKDRVRRSVSMTTLKGVLQRAVDEGRILKEEAEAVLYKFKGIKGTDAQAYRSLTSWRDVMDMVGKADANITQAIDNLKNNRWTMSDFYTVFQTIKPFTYGPEDQDAGVDGVRMRTMVQHKNSEAVLLAIYNTLVGSAEGDANYSPRLRGLNRAMEELELVDDNGNVMTYADGEHMKAIDLAQYHSAVKVGAHGIIDINYSREKLAEIQKAGVLVVGGKNLKIGRHESYYDIAERLGKAVDAEAISEEDYNKAMDALEPDENEVFQIIRDAIYKDKDRPELGYNNQVLHKVPYAYYSIQQPTPNHYTDNTEGTFGSQPRHIIMAELPEDIEVELNGKKYNREQIRERYNGLLVANLLKCYEEQIEPLFRDVDRRKTPAQRLHDRLKPLIEGNPKYSRSLLDAIEVDEKGEFVMPLNNLTVAHQLEEILTSMFKNAIHRQEINGGNAIIAADEGVGYSSSLQIRGKRDENGNLTEIEGIECLLPAHAKKMLEPFLEHKIKRFTGRNGEIEEVECWELNPEKLEEAGLAEAIGYRIPTEGHYSIMPLIIRGFLPQQSGSSIVLAQEVVELTGSDNDVDKMFLMLKRFTGEGDDIQAIGTDGKEMHPMDMTKLQRDNEIIDIFHAILTNPKMSHMWVSPGNFDTLKMEAQKNKIMKNKYLRERFMINAGMSINDFEGLADLMVADPNKDYTELYRRVMEVPAGKEIGKKNMLDVVVDFTDRYQRPLSPVYPDTFISMHQMYMAGVAEKGIYANNTLDHAKLQWANINLTEDTEFMFEGRIVKKLDERYIERTRGGKKYRHYIAKDCAEGSAAAVDNGKDPQLDDINSNKQTATFFGFLIRLGLGLDGAGALMAQPLIDYGIKKQGNVNKKILKAAIRDIETWWKENGFELTDERLNWQKHNFSVREWHINTMEGYLPKLLAPVNNGRGNTAQSNIDRIVSLYCTYNLVLNLMDANSDMQEPRTVIHYDSPTNAADTSFGGVVAQTKVVEEVNNRKNNPWGKRITGEEELVIYNLEKKAAEERAKKGQQNKHSSLTEIAGASEYRRLFDAIMGTQMPITQAFYTLGIEKIRSEFREQFAFGREEMQQLTDNLWDYMNKMNIYGLENRVKIVSQMYNDWVVYRLSKTSLFGNDGTMTFDEKRQYYLYQFPEEFMKLKQQIKELNDIECTRNMYVEKGIILMHRGQKTTVTMRDFITDSFDALLQSPNEKVQEVAKKLFMYTYYLNGFDFNYTSFGNMMSTQFQTAFPEYIQALRQMNSEVVEEEDMDNFFNQMLVKRNRSGLLPTIEYKDKRLREEGLQRGYNDTGETYDPQEDIPEYVKEVHISGTNSVKTEVLRLNRGLSEIHGTVIYQPIRLNTSFHFNANQTLDEMLDTVYDQELINRNRRVGAYQRNMEVASFYDNQNSRDMKEVPTERDAKVAEPPADGSVNNSMLNSVDPTTAAASRDMDETKLLESAGVEAIYDNDPWKRIENYQLKEVVMDGDPTDGVDPDIKEGEEIIKESNNGRVPCV